MICLEAVRKRENAPHNGRASNSPSRLCFAYRFVP
nr:MAG TPA: hypothetical protein [Caudoviricetes sp.]